MAKYISVLNGDIDKSYWRAVQWDETLASINANKYYTAGFNMSVPKNTDDTTAGTKTIIETTTGAQGTATVIKLAGASTALVKLANNNASKTFLKKLEI